jgi:hypothetical protein
MGENIRLCNHCYNTTSHQLIVDGGVRKITHNANVNDRKREISQSFTYFFVKCETCGDYSLLGGFNDQLENLKLADIPVLFPKSGLLDLSVPEEIREIYEKAIQIKNKLPDAFAGQIRRAIESLCIDKKAKGTNLASQLKSLAETGILPDALNEMTTIIRDLGNRGVHAKKEEVTSRDAQALDDFFRFIIEYVYVAPAKTQQVRQNLEIRKLESEYGDLINEIQGVLIDEDPYPWLHESDGGPPTYLYDEETFLIVKRLKNINSKAELLDYVCNELSFTFTNSYHEEAFINPIWDLWNLHKKK